MSGWKNLFQEHILGRGEMYYYDGAVLELHKTEYGYHAIVEGTEDYEVDIEIDEGQVCEMYCSCPYAEEGNNCKHMAAVLYEIEDWDDAEILPEEVDSVLPEEELEEIIENMSQKELRSFVKEIVGHNSDIRNVLMTRYAVKIDEKQMNHLKEGVDQLVWQYGDRSDYIDYRNAWDFIWALERYLEEKTDILLERKCWMEAFELTNYVFRTIGNIDIDDSDGGISEIANACYDKWKAILCNCNEEEKSKIFSWFMSHLYCDYVADYLEDYMEDFLTHEFQVREVLEKKLKYLDEKIEAQGSSTDCGSTWSPRYGYENNIMQRLELMERLHFSKEEIKEYRRKHWMFSAVRRLEIQENYEQGNMDEVIRILQESKILDKEHPGLLAGYSEQLISIYEKQADKKAYKDELRDYVFSYPQNTLTYIQKLKEVCADKEWDDYRERILKDRKNYIVLYPFMEAEGMYERMLEYLKEEGFIYNLDRYEKVLKEKFPEQVRDLYITYLSNQARTAGNRNKYRELMNYLKKIRRYPGGKEKAVEIAKNWRAAYYRRTAMMDEMRKAGF